MDEGFDMKMARVTGSVVSTVKHEGLIGTKLLVLQPILPDGAVDEGSGIILAVDCVGAGVGEVVLVVFGSPAQAVEQVRDKPIDAVVVAIVDTLETEPSHMTPEDNNDDR